MQVAIARLPYEDIALFFSVYIQLFYIDMNKSSTRIKLCVRLCVAYNIHMHACMANDVRVPYVRIRVEKKKKKKKPECSIMKQFILSMYSISFLFMGHMLDVETYYPANPKMFQMALNVYHLFHHFYITFLGQIILIQER